MQTDPENTHAVLYNHRILEYGLSFVVRLASIRLRVKLGKSIAQSDLSLRRKFEGYSEQYKQFVIFKNFFKEY